MCRRPAGDEATCARFEELVGLRGRKFYGAYYLPGGRYLRARLRGEPPAVYGRIGPVFTALIDREAPDESRPSIEFYRRHDEIELLLPVSDQ